MNRRSVLVIDPGNYTPYYDVNLCSALIERGWGAEWWTSPYLFEAVAVPPHVPVRNLFQRGPDALMRRRPWIRRVPVVRRALKALSYPIDLHRLGRELERRRPGLLHVQWALLPGLDARHWRRWRESGWRIVYTAHDVEGLDGTTPRALRGGSRRLYRLADAVAVHSERDAASVVRAGVEPRRVHRLPQGSPGLFQRQAVARDEARRSLGIDPGRPTVLLFGLLKRYKGLSLLLESLLAVQRTIPDVQLVIAGVPLVDERGVAREIARRDLAGIVLREAAFVPSDRVGHYFAAADVVVLPYRTASASAVLVNAAAHARPVVATAVGALSEMVADGETGLLVRSQDSADFARALTDLLLDPRRAEAMGRAAALRAERRHGWARIARKTEAIYEAIDPCAASRSVRST